MWSKISFLIRYYLLWLGMSIIAKIAFLLYETGDKLTGGDYGQIFYRGLRMDLSLGGYVMMLACLIMAFSVWMREGILKKIYSILTVIVLFAFWLIITVDLELFANWGYHVDATPLLYLKTPKEALASTPVGLMIGLVLFMCACIGCGYFLYSRYIRRYLHYTTGKYWQAAVFLLLAGLMIIPVRGGFNVAPMNNSFVFFHKTSMYANQAAINPVWNFIYEVSHAGQMKHKYDFMPEEEARQIIDSIYTGGNDYPHVLRVANPNVVVVLLESFTANAIEALGGEKGVTPNLNKLVKEGILFSNIYATGNRSDRGMTGVISAYPSHPAFSLLKYPNKTEMRPRFSKDMENNGYHTRYYYAGDLNFGGFRSYVTMAFQEIVTEDDFSGVTKEKTFKWGIHDEVMFERLYEDVKKADQPFMYMVFNMSSHEPFEVPMKTHISGETVEKKFLNAIYYSDRCLGDFVQKCKDSGIWDNTLFVFIADHGTIKIGGLQSYEPKAFHIPMLFAGGALALKDTVVSTLGSQTDMVATLLAQLGMDHSAYKYSKNMLAKDIHPFAFYAYSNTVGFITPDGTSVFDLNNQQYITDDSDQRNDKPLKAYVQVLDHDITP